eukprot:gene25436-biopygen10509
MIIMADLLPNRKRGGPRCKSYVGEQGRAPIHGVYGAVTPQTPGKNRARSPWCLTIWTSTHVDCVLERSVPDLPEKSWNRPGRATSRDLTSAGKLALPSKGFRRFFVWGSGCGGHAPMVPGRSQLIAKEVLYIVFSTTADHFTVVSPNSPLSSELKIVDFHSWRPVGGNGVDSKEMHVLLHFGRGFTYEIRVFCSSAMFTICHGWEQEIWKFRPSRRDPDRRTRAQRARK